LKGTRFITDTITSCKVNSIPSIIASSTFLPGTVVSLVDGEDTHGTGARVVTSEKDAERAEWNANPMGQNRTPGCQVFGEIYFRLQFHRVPVHRGRVMRCRVFLVIARHAAHHRDVSTRLEIRCLSNRSNGSPRVRGLSGKVDRRG